MVHASDYCDDIHAWSADTLPIFGDGIFGSVKCLIAHVFARSLDIRLSGLTPDQGCHEEVQKLLFS